MKREMEGDREGRENQKKKEARKRKRISMLKRNNQKICIQLNLKNLKEMGEFLDAPKTPKLRQEWDSCIYHYVQ